MRVGSAIAVLAAALVTASCTSVVDGAAVRGDDVVPRPTTVLGERDLDEILLDDDELGDVLGSPDIEITGEVEEMTDDSDGVSDTDCLGALYSAEEPVYAGTGYTAVLTRLASEPGDDYDHWVEETAVVLPSVEAADQFIVESARQWEDCAGRTVSISDGEDFYDWDLGDVTRSDGVLAQKSTAVDSIDWQCQHTLAAAANLILEASVCAERVDDQGAEVLAEMLAKAAQR